MPPIDPPPSARREQITFYADWLPALGPGEYEVSVTPDLTIERKEVKPVTVTETFYVSGPRFSLTGSEAYSCYPAPGEKGSFDGTLPHIVFDRRTLPWERTIEKNGDPKQRHAPWLALILLTDNDFKDVKVGDQPGRVPLPSPTKLEDLVPPSGDKVIGPPSGDKVIRPDLALDRNYEPGSDLCQTIDLPFAVFDKVMPSLEDLPFLAHVRQVETDNKETWSLLKEGFFSVVICNRFPETQLHAGSEKDWGIVNTVYLVSLEGWRKYLDPKAERAKQKDKSFRLVVLGSWRFTCQGSHNFKSLMRDLDDCLPLSLPVPAGDKPDIGKTVGDALRNGFAALNHDFRNGDALISWYRGPLVPGPQPRPTGYPDISCPDAALRYDPVTGMFDTEYAAAWQLGRLLALQDQAFAQSLYRFRTGYQRWVRRTNAEALKGAEKTMLELLGIHDDMREQFGKRLKALEGWPEPPSTSEKIARPEVPVEIRNWLGQALLLYGVPFSYLVPDQRMLQPETIRFFYLNPDWINCLLLGACSVGRSSRTDELADQLLREDFLEISEQIAGELRSKAKAEADRQWRPADAAPLPPAAPKEKKLDWPLTGYLLRSAAVEAWIGLEAFAYAGDGQKLQILRMDRLAPDILLCIFNGNVTRLEVREPQEGLHFGANPPRSGADYYDKNLRRLADGELLPEAVKVRQRGSTRVIKVFDLKQAMQNQLKPAEITSAEFAVEMIDAPGKVIFSRNVRS
jgi:hypothetical protein